MTILNDDGSDKTTKTTIQSGDRVVLFKDCGTVTFGRNGIKLRDGLRDNDDKFLLTPRNLSQFNEVVIMLAEATGLTAVLESNKNNLVTYRFD